MRPGLFLVTTLALAAVPVGVLAVMAATGAASGLPALLGSALALAAAACLAFLWTRDLRVLAEAVRRASEGASGAFPDPSQRRAPVLGPLQRIGADIERLARATASRATLLGRARRTDEAIVDHLPDPLIMLAADRSVRRANMAARTAFGDDLPALLRHPTLRAAIDRAFAQNTAQQAELSMPVPVPRELRVTAFVMDPPLSDGSKAMIVLADRTREHAVERTRADFVANASHELRTPLASLIGFIDTLRGPAADDRPAQQRFLAIMGEQAARMNRIIDDLLSLSRVEMAEHQPPADRVALEALIPRIVAGFEPRVADRRIALEVRIAEDLPAVLADADQLAQVLHNLLDNAVKYGRDAGRVRLSAARATEGGRWPARPGVVLAVADDGQGIAREHLPRLTERFYRVDAGRSRSVGGTGLGLAIVKHIVNRHRGQLLITSEVGAGTTVSVWLPQVRRDLPPSREPGATG